MANQFPTAGQGNFNSVNLVGLTAGYLQFSVPATVTSYQLKWPSAQGAAGQQLQNDGSGNLSWADPAGGAVTTMGAFGSTPNANGGSIASNTLTLQPASASFPGGVSTGAQAFAGQKTFGSGIILANGAAATPSLTWAGDSSDTGLFFGGLNTIGFASGGAQVAQIGEVNTFLAPHTSAFLFKALWGNANGLQISCNTSTDVCQILNFYSANLEIGTANTVFQTISAAGAIVLGAAGGSQAHQANGTSLSVRRDFDGTTMLQVRNDDTGASAAARLAVTSDQGDLSIYANSGAAGDSVQITADSTFGGGLQIGILGPNTLSLRTNGTDALTISGAQVVTIGTGTATTHRLNTTVQSTVGSAGAASALPAQPTGYVLMNINGTDRAIPYYDAA